MSENLDLVHSICADWARGDYSSAAWAHPEIDYELVGGKVTRLVVYMDRDRVLADVGIEE
jgi:hypothetical protein